MDQSFRTVTPYFRLRYDSPWEYELLTYFVIAVALTAAVSIAIASVVRRYRDRKRAKQSFRHISVERGLSESQCRQLEMISIEARIVDPLLLFSSLTTFDRSVAQYLKQQTNGHVAGNTKLVDRIYKIRQRLGFDQVPTSHLLPSTRELPLGQKLMVWPANGGRSGFCQCAVTHREDQAITAVPVLREDEGFFATLGSGDLVKVRFWRDDDTEYRFRSRIIESVPETTGITIAHGDTLQRIQKRDFFRLEVQFDVVLYVVPSTKAEGVAKAGVTAVSGTPVAATVTDISGGGMSAIIDGPVPDDHVFVVDPKFEGAFPIAGINCVIIDQVSSPDGLQTRLEFRDLGGRSESDLVNAIYRHQIEHASRR